MKKENSLVGSNSKNNLVLGLNIDGEIVQFDKECQRITGYTRTEVFNKKIRDFLIPTSYVTKWNELFNSAVKNEDIGDFEIPLKTFDGEEILISWSALPLENRKGTVRNICFIGKNLENRQYKKSSKAIRQDNDKKRIKYIQDDNKPVDNEMRDFKNRMPTDSGKLNKTIKDMSKKHKKNNKMSNNTANKKEKKNERSVRKNKLMFKKDNKNINFGKNSSLNPDKCSTDSKKLLSLGFKKSVTKSEESNTMNKTVKDLSKKYEKLSEKLKELEKKDRKLERKNKLLEKNLKNLKTHMKKSSKIKLDKKLQYSQINIQKTKKDKYSFKKMPDFLHDSLGIKKKRESFELRIHALDERAKELGELEDHLLKDRKIHDKRIAEFTAWKEKLLSLEAEIEKRRRDIVELEDALRENISLSSVAGSDFDAVSSGTEDASSDKNVVQEDYHELLDKIPQCAAIIQRSIIKQINSSFAELIGFETDEIVEKSLFDFIAPEGLADIEKYYLGRLKGSGSSTYETIFSTKDDSKIQVEVSVKPTTYNGEKAEMAVVQEMDDTKAVDTTSNDSEDIPEMKFENDIDDNQQDSKDDGCVNKEESRKISTLSTTPSDDRIQEIIAETQGKQVEAGDDVGEQAGSSGDVPEAEVSSTGAGKMSQDAINALLKKSKDKQK